MRDAESPDLNHLGRKRQIKVSQRSTHRRLQRGHPGRPRELTRRNRLGTQIESSSVGQTVSCRTTTRNHMHQRARSRGRGMCSTNHTPDTMKERKCLFLISPARLRCHRGGGPTPFPTRPWTTEEILCVPKATSGREGGSNKNAKDGWRQRSLASRTPQGRESLGREFPTAKPTNLRSPVSCLLHLCFHKPQHRRPAWVQPNASQMESPNMLDHTLLQ